MIEMTSKERSSLVEKRDQMITEAVCRTLGHSDWTYDDVSTWWRIRVYADGSSVFAFKGMDMLLFEPPGRLDTGQIVQPVQYLYDKTDFKYMTLEERYGVPHKELIH